MAKAVLCPVCNGHGKYCPTREKCHGCQGQGWVEVAEDIPQLVPCVPSYYPPATTGDPSYWYNHREVRGEY